MSRETTIKAKSGWGMLGLDIGLFIAAVGSFIFGIVLANTHNEAAGISLIILGIIIFLGAILISIGFIVLQPNQAGVALLFGKYVGAIRQEGFYWENPFYTKKKISLRLRNLNGAQLKVNDSAGNPDEIATVVVWKVADTFAARTKIVEGAVGLVQMALKQLSAEKIVEFDDDRRMAMVSNLLVVLCGETNAQPVVSAGSLSN